MVQLNCHISGVFSTDLERKKTTHTIREFLHGFTHIFETAYNICQTCSSPKAKFIKYQLAVRSRCKGIVSKPT